MQAQVVARRISGAVAGEVFAQVKTYQYPSQTFLPRITLFATCLSFSSPSLHPCRFIRPLSLYPPSLSLLPSFCLLHFLPLCLKLGKLLSIWTIIISWKILMLLLKNPLSYIQKNSESVVVILLEKELSKISLLVPVLCLLWVVLSFIELVVLRTLLSCL